MKKLLLILFIFIGFYGNAQVGIGTDMPNPSSQLEIVANDRGVLIPQVPLSGLTDKTTITNGNVESLLVFNTSTTNNIVPGYYYWYNGSWKRIASSDNTNTNIPDNIVIWNSENEEFVYLNKDGDRVNISLNEIANESITTLIDNLDGTYTYTSEDNTVTTINVPADVIGNINNNGIIYEKIINLITSNNFNSSITDNGDGTFTYTNTQGNSTNFDANTTTLVDNGDGTYDLTNADGSTININTNAASNTYDNTNSGLASGNVQDALDEIQQNLEDTSSDFGNIDLTDNGDGTFTFTDGDGNPTNFDANTTTYTNNNDGSYTFTNANGETMTISVVSDVVTNIQNQGDIYNEIINIVGDTSDALVDNDDGTFTHTAMDGTEVTFNANTTSVTETDGVYTFTNPAGNTITTIDTNASALGYDNTNSGLASGNVQDALDEIAGTTGIVSPLSDNGDGSFTYTDESGASTTFDTNNVNVSLASGIYTFNDADGNTITTIDTNASALGYDNTNSGLTSGNVQDALDEIQQNLEDTSSDFGNIDLADNGDGTFTFTDGDGNPTNFDANTTTYTNNNDGTYTFTNANGDSMTVTVVSDVVTNIQNQGDIYNEIINIVGDTSDALVDNDDGTFTHTAMDGTEVTFNANTTSVTETDGVYTFIDPAGNTITTIDTNASALGYDNTNSGLASGNVQDALDEIQQNLEDTSSDFGNIDLTDNGDGTFTFTDGDGNSTNFDANTTTYTNNNDGSYTFTNANGETMTISVVSDVVTNIQNQGDIYNEIINIVGDTSDALVDNDDGTFTHTAMDGTEVTFNANTTSVTETDGVYTFTNPAGNTITTIDTNASALGYDNTNSGLASGNVQDALDEIAGTTGIVSPLSDNGDGSFTYTDESGASTTFDTNNVNVSLASGIYTFNDADGNTITTIDTNASALGYDNTNSGLASGNVQDALDEIQQNLEDTSSDFGNIDLTDNGDGTFTFTDGDGNPTNFDANTTTYTNNNDGSYTFTNANGDSMTVTLVSDVVTNIQNQGDIYNEIINIVGDTSDALVDNGDGTFTHTAMDGTEVTFNANTTSVTETDGVYTFTDPAGNTITTIDTNASALGYDNTNSGLASGNVQDALDEIAGTTGIISPLLDNGDGSFTYTDESGASTTFDTNNVSVSLASGIYTFNDADGNTITTIDTNASAIAFDNSTNQFTANNVQDALEELATLVDTNKGDLTVDGGIEFTGGTDGVNKLLDDMGIQIADGGINTIKLADGAVTAPKLSSGVGAPNQVLTTDGNGNDAQLAWKNIEDFAPAPNFFYMPAVIFETIQTGTGLQRNLYEDYKNQFSGQQFDVAHGASGSSRTYTGGLVGSTGAPSAIHVFESNELYYYITYYDQDVFANLTIDENGVLTYDIINDASPTSYMNIVFVIKNE